MLYIEHKQRLNSAVAAELCLNWFNNMHIMHGLSRNRLQFYSLIYYNIKIIFDRWIITPLYRKKITSPLIPDIIILPKKHSNPGKVLYISLALPDHPVIHTHAHMLARARATTP